MNEKEKKIRRKKKLGSYPIANVVISISLALFFVGVFGILYIHAKQLKNSVQNNMEVQVYLKKELSNSEITKLQKTLGDKEYVSTNDGMPRVMFVSKEQAAEKFIEETGEDFLKFLGDNPLRDVIIININPEYQTAHSLASIKKELEVSPSVFEVSYVESLVESINTNLRKISVALIGIALLLFVTVIILIHNTIKLALFSQRFLIRSMQLVGATASFIRRPFLLRSLFYGLIAGIASSAILIAFTKIAYEKIDGLIDLFDFKQTLILFGSLLALGIAVSFFSTLFAIKKYLKMSLDELY